MTPSAAGSRITVKSEMADAPASRSRSTRGASSGLRTSPFSRSRPCALAASLLLSLSATLLAASLAGAQGGADAACCNGDARFEARYSIRPIVQLMSAVGSAPSFDRLWYGDGTDSRHGVLSMNSNGEVVGTKRTQAGAATEFAASWIGDTLLRTPPSNGAVIERAYDVLPTGEILCLVRRNDQGTGFHTVHYAAVLMAVGDINGDRVTGPEDLALMLASWGNLAQMQWLGDFNSDSRVDGEDLAVVFERWGLPTDRLSVRVPSETGQEDLCFALPADACFGIGSSGHSMEPAAVERLRCAGLCLGHPTPEDFVQWAGLATVSELQCKCEAMADIIRHLETEAGNE